MQARSSTNARGIDVSIWQGRIDWAKVKDSGISFAFVKATERSTMRDVNVEANISGAKAAGLLVGAYHFTHAKTPQEAVHEAEWFLSTVGVELDLPPVLDIEVPYTSKLAIRAWVDHVEQLTGVKPILYTNSQYLDAYLADDYLKDCPLWYAMYGNDQPGDRRGWTHWTFFQHTDRGSVPGIVGAVDLDEYEGSVEELMQALKPAPISTLTKDTAASFVLYCQHQYQVATNDTDRKLWHDRANEARKAAGIAET